MLVDAVINQSSQTSETISLNHCFNQWSKCVGQGISNNLSNPIAQQKQPPQKKDGQPEPAPFSHNHGFSVKKWVNSPIVLTFQSQLELWRFLVRNPNLNVHFLPKNLHPFLQNSRSLWDPTRFCFSNLNDSISIEATGAWNWKLGKGHSGWRFLAGSFFWWRH